MKLRSLQLAAVLVLMATALFMAFGAAAQEDIANLALTATALAGGDTATPSVTPLPSLTPGGSPLATSTPAPGGNVLPVTPLPSVTPGLRASLTPLPSLTPPGTPAPTEVPTETQAASLTPAPSSTPLPSQTPVPDGAAVESSAPTTAPEALTTAPEATAADQAPVADQSSLAPISIGVPYVSVAQKAPEAPTQAAGVGTLILLIGLGGATVIGLLMLARDRFRDHRDD